MILEAWLQKLFPLSLNTFVTDILWLQKVQSLEIGNKIFCTAGNSVQMLIWKRWCRPKCGTSENLHKHTNTTLKREEIWTVVLSKVPPKILESCSLFTFETRRKESRAQPLIQIHNLTEAKTWNWTKITSNSQEIFNHPHIFNNESLGDVSLPYN